jgi:GT2 family glycosyltransferase
MPVKVTVSIPTVRPRTLKSAIDSIRRQSWTDWELLVVGQGTDPELRQITEALTREDSRIRYLHLDRMGISHARNAAIAAAQGEIIAFTDDDCEAEPNWLETVVKCFEEDPRLGFLSGALHAPPIGRHLLAVCPTIHPPEVSYDPATDRGGAPAHFDFAGANLALRREAALRVGSFDECLGVGAIFASSEDLDYMLRAEAAGVKIRSTPSSVVHHTYGVRYGLRAVFRHRRSYAVGQGALAAKLTLRGDPRGQVWLDAVWDDLRKTISDCRLHRTPHALLRYFYVRRAYKDCLQHHEVDGSTGLYKPPPSPARST